MEQGIDFGCIGCVERWTFNTILRPTGCDADGLHPEVREGVRNPWGGSAPLRPLTFTTKSNQVLAKRDAAELDHKTTKTVRLNSSYSWNLQFSDAVIICCMFTIILERRRIPKKCNWQQRKRGVNALITYTGSCKTLVSNSRQEDGFKSTQQSVRCATWWQSTDVNKRYRPDRSGTICPPAIRTNAQQMLDSLLLLLLLSYRSTIIKCIQQKHTSANNAKT